MLTGNVLNQAISQLLSRPLRNTFVRAVPLAYAQDPLGRGRPIAQNRFNKAGGARVLYMSEDHVTCLQETQAFGWPYSAVALVPVQLDLMAVVDLRDKAVQQVLLITQAEITFNFRSLPYGSSPAATQILGEALAGSGRIDGLIFESIARPPHQNIAVFEGVLGRLGSSVEVNDPKAKLFDKLP